jgi:lipoprotein-releasing system permease protein
MIKICFLSIFIGTASLMITLIIMNGFEKTISEKMQGINADLLITPKAGKIDSAPLTTFLEKEFTGAIQATSGSSIRQVIFDNKTDNAVVFIKGVKPADEARVSIIGSKIIASLDKEHRLEQLLKENYILIGKKLAEEFDLVSGSTFTILVPEPKSSSSIRLTNKEVIVAGIFSVGIEELDHNVCYANLSFFNRLFEIEQGVDMLSIRLTQNYQKALSKKYTPFQIGFWKQLIKQIKQKCSLTGPDEYASILKKLKAELPEFTIASWKELHPALVSSLKLEKYVMFFILALITLVASMNMISLLFMQLQQKRRDIAILKSMGMMQKDIKKIFLLLGMSITCSAAGLGLLVAAGVGYLLETYPFLELPDVYFVSHLPARMELELFIVVGLSVLLLGFLATWLPSRRIDSINITEVLRQE